jgi:hypothetical protein
VQHHLVGIWIGRSPDLASGSAVLLDQADINAVEADHLDQQIFWIRGTSGMETFWIK